MTSKNLKFELNKGDYKNIECLKCIYGLQLLYNQGMYVYVGHKVINSYDTNLLCSYHLFIIICDSFILMHCY